MAVNPNDPFIRDALHARLRFYRELGIGELYRREVDASAWAAPEPSQSLRDPLPNLSPSQSPNPFRDLSPSRPSDPAIAAVATASPVAANPTSPATLPAMFSTPLEETQIAPRKPVPSIPPQAPPVPAEQHFAALKLIREDIGDCTRCQLSATRNKIVFGDGDPNAKLFFVGEGPGADEDASGLPFVGRGGQLLNNMIQAMGLKREQVYIANVVKCRPPANRTPEPDEAHTCSPFLFRQIDVVRPQVIVALGQTAVTYLTGEKRSLAAWRGTVHPLRGSKLIVTYHPAFLLRDPSQKKHAWADLQVAMRELGLTPPARG
jgi:DNA polymerase